MRHLRLPEPTPLLQSLVLALLLLTQPGLVHAFEQSGILPVAFGTSVDKARSSPDDVGRAYEKASPGKPIVWAYTSDIIRQKPLPGASTSSACARPWTNAQERASPTFACRACM